MASASDAGAAAVTLEDNFPQMGITLVGIQLFMDAHGGQAAFKGLTTAAVCRDIVMPATRASGLSVCETMAASVGPAAAEVRPATVFLSHTWSYDFMWVVTVLESWDRRRKESWGGAAGTGTGTGTGECGGDAEQPAFWFDILSNSQHGTESRGFAWWTTVFCKNIARINHTLLLFDYNYRDPPRPLTRAWCLWEMHCSISTGARTEVVMEDGVEKPLAALLHSGSEDIDILLDACNLHAAQATDTRDLEGIVNAVSNTMGVDAFNCSVQACIVEWLGRVTLRGMQRAGVHTDDNYYRRKTARYGFQAIFAHVMDHLPYTRDIAIAMALEAVRGEAANIALGRLDAFAYAVDSFDMGIEAVPLLLESGEEAGALALCGQMTAALRACIALHNAGDEDHEDASSWWLALARVGEVQTSKLKLHVEEGMAMVRDAVGYVLANSNPKSSYWQRITQCQRRVLQARAESGHDGAAAELERFERELPPV